MISYDIIYIYDTVDTIYIFIVYIYSYLFISIYIYLYLFISIYIYSYLFISIYVYLCLYMSIYVYCMYEWWFSNPDC